MSGVHKYALAVSAVALIAANPASAQERADVEKLIDLVKQQQSQIADLKARLEKLEAEQQASAASAAAAPTGTAQATPPTALSAKQQQQAAIDAQVQNAVADSQSSETAAMQAQLAQLAANSERGVDVRWRTGGPAFESKDGFFTFRPRGDFLFDFSHTWGSDFADRNITGTEIRDVRLGMEGSVGKIGYKVDVGFDHNDVHLKEAYLSYDAKLFGNTTEFYVGQRLEDRSIEGSTTKRRIPFMERNAVATVGAPDLGFFNTGVLAKMIGPNWHISVSASGDGVTNEGDESDSYAFFARGHWNPIKTNTGFVHLGAWGWTEYLGSDADSINEFPDIAQHFNTNLHVSASSIDGTIRDHAYGLEAGGVFHNLYAFGEYTDRFIRANDDPSAHQKAYSLYGGWMITGEDPSFSTRSGIWGSTKVIDPVTSGGTGAFELAGRYDNYDFSDERRGGIGHSWTLGVNWYLNNWARLMVNYVRWHTDNQVSAQKGPDSGNSIGVRSQISF
ncbi:OprO/OprP family phosphate-selective porin [Stakelama saccharophila]|uniref:Porin n=1 Tax=Stakelama saccharophila TaxID=3075605 RepID=A0ABZ0B9U8_9SPHN|nr:porin [Stakelama sp. W311]WNO53633.1 porin [Stakelama sp. W311]